MSDLEAFLDFLAKDMEENPHHIKPFPHALIKRANDLLKDIEVNLDEPIEGNVNLG